MNGEMVENNCDVKPSPVTEEDEGSLSNNLGVKDAEITRIWHVINVADKYHFDVLLLRGFFEKRCVTHFNLLIDSMDEDFARQLAFSCYIFDPAEGFSSVTKWFAYNFAGHTTEKTPSGIVQAHASLSAGLVGEYFSLIKHIHGSLKTPLHRGIWDKVGKVLEHGEQECRCGRWASVCGRYFAKLVNVDA
ncbi:hypothetical protein PMIN03_004089 [Paraphaeosphaeria minitans]